MPLIERLLNLQSVVSAQANLVCSSNLVGNGGLVAAATAELTCSSTCTANGSIGSIINGTAELKCSSSVMAAGTVTSAGKSGTIVFDPYTLGIAYGMPSICTKDKCDDTPEKKFSIIEIELLFMGEKYSEIRTRNETITITLVKFKPKRSKKVVEVKLHRLSHKKSAKRSITIKAKDNRLYELKHPVSVGLLGLKTVEIESKPAVSLEVPLKSVEPEVSVGVVGFEKPTPFVGLAGLEKRRPVIILEAFELSG